MREEGLIRQAIQDLVQQGPVTLDVWKSLKMNSYERNYLLEFVTDEALLHIGQQTLQNIQVDWVTTYEEFATAKLLPEVLTRLAKRVGQDVPGA